MQHLGDRRGRRQKGFCFCFDGKTDIHEEKRAPATGVRSGRSVADCVLQRIGQAGLRNGPAEESARLCPPIFVTFLIGGGEIFHRGEGGIVIGRARR